ncbi:hypothetical protein [Grimontia hollisae]|uniref:hypothetical protein n=1 Tax=Grimontia hollisae TaxID=673 RepID=UPI001303AF84|nr:hypothetical protein [Grimontia hollisae]
MIRLEGILKDALGNAVLPQALIEFISKVNAGKALIQSIGAIVDYHATIDGVIVEGIASSDAGASVSGLPLLVHVVNGC